VEQSIDRLAAHDVDVRRGMKEKSLQTHTKLARRLAIMAVLQT
jgi:hypothetical protein